MPLVIRELVIRARVEAAPGEEDKRAARLSKDHANTPATVFLDSLGRDVVSVEHNKFKDAAEVLHDEKYLTITKLDAEGKPMASYYLNTVRFNIRKRGALKHLIRNR